MIFEAALIPLLNGFVTFLKACGIGNFSLPAGSIDTFLNVLDSVAYFVPVPTILFIFSTWVSFELTKIMISALKFLLKFVPFVG